jgi:hypothetical protein
VVIRYADETTSENAKSKSTHLNKTFDMKKTMLCRDAMVEITKVKIEPKWGLFNSAIGTVDIILKREKIQMRDIYQQWLSWTDDLG